jgi:hypothetical protein
MTPLAAAALAAGELICEFHASPELMLVYEAIGERSAEVVSSARPGRREVLVRPSVGQLHLIERDGPSVRVTTLTGCTRGAGEACTRFAARHAWHFDANAHLDPEHSLERQPAGASTGSCEPWRIDP